MTDFLKRVSQTALGLAPVAQPLVASRYAQPAHQPAPEMLPPQEPPPESFVNHAPEPYAETLSPSPPPSHTTASINRAPEQTTAANVGQQESAGIPSHEIASTKMTSAASPQPDSIDERRAMPFDVPSSPLLEPLNTQDQTEPTPQTRARTIASGTESEQSVSLTTDDESYAPQDAERRAVEIVDAQHAPHRRRDEESARASTTREVATFVAGETAPLVHGNERSAQVSPVLSVETTIRRDSPTESFKQGSVAEHEIEADEARAASMAQRNESNSSDQSTARRAASLLLSTQEDKAANASTGHVVHVTIGRIDVRAVMPPPLPVKSPSPPAPQLSLDEYLRQHNGRTR